MILKIYKKSEKVWQFVDSLLGEFIPSRFSVNTLNNDVTIVFKDGADSRTFSVLEVELYDIGAVSPFPTFATTESLMAKLEEMDCPCFFIDGDYVFVPLSWVSSDEDNALEIGTDGKFYVRESESSIKSQINNGYEFFCDFNQSFTSNQVVSGELFLSATGGGGNNQQGSLSAEYQDVLNMIMQTSATSRVYMQSGGSFISGAFEFLTLIIPQTLCTLTEKYRLITGLGSTQADSDQLQGIYFLYDKYGEGNVGIASDNYLCVCKNGASISVVDSGIPYEVLVGRKLGFLKNSDGTEVTFFIDNIAVATITTNIPSVSMRVMNVCEKYLGTGSATVSFDYIYYKNFKDRM